MKKHTQARSSSLLLMELIISISLFIAVSAVCVQLLSKAHQLSSEAARLNHAVSSCSSIAEVISTSDSSDAALAKLAEVYPLGKSKSLSSGKLFTVFFDENNNSCSTDEAVYAVKTEMHIDGGMLVCTISDGDSYSLKVKHYTGEKS